MAKRSLQEAVDDITADGESAIASCRAQLKKGDGARRLAKDVGVSLALSTLLSATGFGVMSVTTPPPVWAVVTRDRLLLFERPDGGKKAGDLIVEFQLSDLALSVRSTVLTEIRVDDRVTRENVLRLNCGVNKKPASEVVAAARRD